ncbi:MAG TPA: autotransporter-associated beta strand repeat-containing protein [Vicinamibacterales bacterium]|nr:autotransporter-associated beta strand repeat-containing protein [Vicinamibacterales bacterium]
MENLAPITTRGSKAYAIFAQSLGGGGGNGGFNISGAGAGTAGISLSMGGSGGAGGGAGEVFVINWSALTTSGDDAAGLYAQSLGGGGGSGGFNISGSGGGTGAFTLGVGGSGDSGGIASRVDVTNRGAIETFGLNATGLFAQSLGGGGGQGRFNISGSGAGTGAGSLAFGGSGGGGGDAGSVFVLNQASITTHQNEAVGLFAQSLGGGGGNGGFNISGSGAGTGSGSIGVGGSGDGGGLGGAVEVTNQGLITTSGAASTGLFAQSTGGGGGSGRFSITGSGAGTGSGTLGIGGSGDGGGNAGTVRVTSEGGIITSGDDAIGLFAQSIGGGGGNGGFSIAGSGAGTGSGTVDIGGSGAGGGNGAAVSVAHTGVISTLGAGSTGLFAQSLGGGGGFGRFSIAGSGAKSGSGTFSLGGSGGGGGTGSTVNVNSAGLITTTGELAYGILAQSTGGGGGAGGFSFGAGLATTGGQFNSSLGGFGGTAGNADTVTVTNAAQVITTGAGAHAIYAESVGGGGGTGGFSGVLGVSTGAKPNVGFSIGGVGATAGNGALVTLDNLNSTFVSTAGAAAYGLFAQSVGGGGGDAGGSLVIEFGKHDGGTNLGLSFGGPGGAAGNGGAVDLKNGAAILTVGERSDAIVAQSLSEGGGMGGFSATGVIARGSNTKDLSVSVGGVGGIGGSAGTVTIENFGSITARGGGSRGIFAQSVGGSGGDGGFSFSGTFAGAAAKEGSIAVGGFGGEGGAGGTVQVQNFGAIDLRPAVTLESVQALFAAQPTPPTELEREEMIARLYTGKPAAGIVAQSVGGGGGNGGHSLAIGLGAIGKKEITGKPGPWTLNTSITVGGFGGAGNAGGLVTVDNFGSVITGEDDADAIFAQSIGGGGGRGGSANSAVISTGVVNEGQAFNTNLSLGGFGGDGNVGGIVDVRNGGTIFTSGDISNGIRAQSIGGGGGVAGSARGVNLMLGATFQKGEEPGDSWKLAAEVGGWGGDGNDGGGVTVSNSATITTTGALSRGIFAQSIGGGGGSGGDGMDGTGVDQVDLAFTVLEFVGNFTSQYRESVKSKGKGFLEDQLREWSFTVGGNQGAKGDASVVNISNSGNIFTSGYGSAAILAQSVGGGGGEATGYSQVVDAGGTSEAGAMGKFGIGGAGGSGGNGGLVSVINSGLLSTMGENAHGIFAQSVGGGGGMAGKVERMLPEEKQVLGFTIPALNIGLGLDYGRAGGSGGDGGEVDVFSTGDIITRGTAAYGIFAQSVGGGGGLAGGVGKISELLSEIGPINFAGSVGGSGSAGNVTVRQTGTIQTEGVGADGIFAQSAGGQGSGGIVDLRVIGNIFAMGEASRGILAQSRGDAGAGNIEIELLGGGTILGGLDGVADKDTVIRGIGVNIVEGAANTLTNFSTITTMSGIAGLAVQSTTGDETIRNSGTLIGSIELGAGTNRLLNRDSGRVFAGSTIDLGAGNLFTNAGLLSIGDAGDVRTTTLTGDFEIENAPRLLVDLGEIGVSDVFDIRGRQIANGVNRFDLNMLTTPAGNGAYTVMTASGGGISRDALGFGTLFGAMPLGRTFDVAATPDAASITLQPSAGTFVWSGGASEFWNSPFVDGISNWTRGGAGNSFVYGTPGAATDVVFATADGTSALGADFSINSLTFAGAGSASRGDTVGIAAGNLLTLLSRAGITMQAGAAHATIATDVVIGTDQQWTNDGGGVLAIVGDSIRGVNRTLTVGGSGATFIGAAIDTGAGALVKEGSGTLQLAGDNSYSGGTFVRGGVLIGDATSLAGAIVNDAVVMFDQTTTGTYAGVMSGGGTFVKDGAGTLRLTGANTYRGGTAIFGGTLIGDTGSLQGDILDDAELAFDQADHGTYAGRLFGSGALAKTGAGTLTLSGLSGGFSGAIDVLAGSLVVDGFAGTGSLLMRRGTILGGTGFLPTTTVQDGATLSPGHSIGTITVVGDLTLAAGSSLRIEIDAAGTSDVVLATGSILLAGGSLDLRHLGAAEYLPITRYGFLAAEDGIEGAFGAVTTDLSFLEPSVQYGESEIYLTLRRTDVDFSRPGIDGSGGRVASALNALVMRADGEMASLVNTLFALPTADLAISLRSMSGAHYQHVATASLDDAERFMGVNFTRLGQPLAAAAGEGGTENAVSTIAGGMQASDVAPTGWWLRGLGGTTRQAGNGIDPAARVPSTGLAIGVDTRLGRRVTFGVSGARTTPRVVSDDLGDETHTRVWHLGAYGRYRQGASRVDVGVAGSSQEYRSERQVLAGATRATARADYDGDGLSARAEYGHAIAAGRTITLEPVAGLRYETLSFDGATETGADPIGLVLPARDVSSLRTTLGGRIEKRLGSAASAIWRLEGRAAWSHDFDARPDIRMTLVGDPDAAFSVAPMNQGRDTGLFGATIYGDAGASFRLFGDVSFETGGPVKGVSASLGFGRRW